MLTNYLKRLHVTCVSIQVSKVKYVTKIKVEIFLENPMCQKVLESWCQMQFNAHADSGKCYICYKSHITHATCHKYQAVTLFTNDQMFTKN